jgi:hypothetical protein
MHYIAEALNVIFPKVGIDADDLAPAICTWFMLLVSTS